ncbi:hypothetical protein [Pseudomonas gessardii]|uniref:DUF433 domain-containing protein n=1 Tax=Pseudomonas gessardii TaxID=78544 RepID=A0ABS9FFP9_9PSED|nr:hypothetical protein [Pseudomonas gessardii]MBH3424127.1 hypothetical protein [Pseudomonas gessardii]MCF4980964.1 hypothetical protein [Pseudomonas gessardii]MCF4988849.1 hypothetical protein [Pseudomonas gessardii]MCF5086278.1 hypothetical protein [Pseudomonas gessardii]MCF5095810.1 hypothetical protein [Pseudomonas gessardii]
MNADINLVYKCTRHPLVVRGDAIHTLVLWLKANGSRRIRQTDPRRVIRERYPAGLFSEDEVQALCELIQD